MKNVSKLLVAMSLGLLVGCPADDDGDTGVGTQGTAGDDGVMTDPTAGDDGVTMGDDDGVTMGDDDGMVDTTMGPADDDGMDDGGAMVCEHTCAADEDCTVAGGTDIGFTCNDGTCGSGASSTCASDDECVPVLSGWSAVACTMGGGECVPDAQACVDLGNGDGGCATVPSEFVMCETFGQMEVMATDLDSGEEVTVCGNTSGVCHADGFCYVPCEGDADCIGGLLTCGDDGLCGCTSDQQCADIPDAGLDTCQDGGCIATCTGDKDCMNPFDGGTVACGGG